MIEPLITVIIPLYNKEKWVKRAVQSVLDQSYIHTEIYIVNDGSTDNSLDIVKMFNDKRINIIDKPNGGVSSARNEGINYAKGEYIAFLDADDEWKAKHLEVLLEGFIRFKDAIVSCDDLVELHDGKTEKDVEKRNVPFYISEMHDVQYFQIEEYLKTLRDDYFILSGSSVLIKLSVINEHNLRFYETLTHGEDVNYWIQLNQHGKFVFSNYLGLLYHKDDEQSAMNDTKKKVQFTPDYFYNVKFELYKTNDQRSIVKFLQREYYKKSYQNRGLPFSRKEISAKIGEINIGYLPILIYVAIRFSPSIFFTTLKKIQKLKGKL